MPDHGAADWFYLGADGLLFFLDVVVSPMASPAAVSAAPEIQQPKNADE